ncbi:MAG: hypothetical protein K2F76_07930 [Duncaniella dubosii]|nr:hypothetical protein [Duncaniella dubosii]
MIKFCQSTVSAKIISCMALLVLTMMFCNESCAKTHEALLCGRVYLKSGDSILAHDSLRIGKIVKKHKIEIISHAYTKNSKILARIPPEDIDSVVAWVSTAPRHTHVFRFIPTMGWSFVMESSPHVSVLCFASKGYLFAGNGGLWMRGKSELLVVKGTELYKLGSPASKTNGRFRRQLCRIVSDDILLVNYIENAEGRRDKIIRHLKLYNPQK